MMSVKQSSSIYTSKIFYGCTAAHVRAPSLNMVLIILDELFCDIHICDNPTSACMCAPLTLRLLKSLQVNRRLRTPPFFNISILA